MVWSFPARPIILSPATLGAAITMAVLGVAAVLKLSDLDHFRASLDSWEIIPTDLKPMVAGIVPILELTVCVGWFWGASRRAFTWAGLLLLGVFTIAYATQAIVASPPNCDCFGKWVQFRELKANAWWVAARNTLLLSMLAAYLRPPRLLAPQPPHPSHSLDPADHTDSVASDGMARADVPAAIEEVSRTPQARRGFTLVEILVVISIVSIVLAISVTGLAGARQRAVTIRGLANLSSVQRGFTAYTADFKDTFPCLVAPAEASRAVVSGPWTTTVRYFDQAIYWHLFLAESYFGVPWDSKAIQPGNAPGGLVNAFWYCHTFVTAPEYWDLDLRTGPSQRRSTRSDEVLFPSAKVGVITSPAWNTVGREGRVSPFTLAAKVDGSASRQDVESFVSGLMPGPDAIADGATEMIWPGMGTRGGARGRDTP